MINETHKDRIVVQVSSARWWLTIAAGICLLMLTATYCRIAMIPESTCPFSLDGILAIISMVFTLYFSKPKNGEDNGNGNGKE